MSILQQLTRLTRRFAPPPLGRALKRLAIYPRYAADLRECRRGFRKFGHLYEQKVLFIAGLPKSGSTWLKRMVCSHPGFHEILIPEASFYDLRAGGCHDYDLPQDAFSRFKNMLVVTKMHVHGSPHNVELLRAAGLKYVVLFRDLRDVAVSYYYYLRRTPWHSEYTVYSHLSVQEGLETFARRTLPAFVDWVRSWERNRDQQMSLVVRYEDMISNTQRTMSGVVNHFGFPDSPEDVTKVVDAHSFRALSGGRRPGDESVSSFFRKGVSGDWRNHFTPQLRDIYKSVIGDFLVEHGYEQDHSW